MYDELAANRRRSILLIVAFTLLVFLAGWAFSQVVGGGPIGLVVALVFSLGSSLTAYYKSDKVDGDLRKAQLTTSGSEKASLYKDAQEELWRDAPWAPLVTERLLSAHNKKLSGVYVIPDASFNFTEVDLK